MAAGVKLHPAGVHLRHVQVGKQNVLFVPHGAGHCVAVGVQNAAAAPADLFRQGFDLLRAGQILRRGRAAVGLFKAMLYRFVPR